MINDATQAAGRVFAAYDQMCQDLASLAADFGAAVGEKLQPFETSSEYSYSPNKLFAKPAHAWYWESRLVAAGQPNEVRFAAMLVVFKSERYVGKVAAPGRPEIWFFAGTVKGEKFSMNAQEVATFLGEVAGAYSPPLRLGPPASVYTYEDENEQWRTACLGLELGDVDRADAIETKVLEPLLGAL